MERKNPNPTREQAQVIARHELNRLLWIVMEDQDDRLIVKHRFTGEFRVIEK